MILAESSVLRNLTVLDLNYNQITDAGARALAESSGFSKLEKINFQWNRFQNKEEVKKLFDPLVELKL